MESGPKRPSPLWPLGPTSIIVVYIDPLGQGLGLKSGQRNDEALKPDGEQGCGHRSLKDRRPRPKIWAVYPTKEESQLSSKLLPVKSNIEALIIKIGFGGHYTIFLIRNHPK